MSVNAIRKQSTDEEVTSLAKSLIKSWKKLLGNQKVLPFFVNCDSSLVCRFAAITILTILFVAFWPFNDCSIIPCRKQADIMVWSIIYSNYSKSMAYGQAQTYRTGALSSVIDHQNILICNLPVV